MLPKPSTARLRGACISFFPLFVFFSATIFVGLKERLTGCPILVVALDTLQTVAVFLSTVCKKLSGSAHGAGVRCLLWLAMVVFHSLAIV